MMAQASTLQRLRTDGEGRIVQDLPCVVCGYNLRSLLLDAYCPECGKDIERSLDATRLWFANPAWLRRVARGLKWLIWGTITAVVCKLVFSKGVLLVARPNTEFSFLIDRAGECVDAAMSVIVLFTWWLVTSPEPAETAHPPSSVVRRVARTSFAASSIAPWLYKVIWMAGALPSDWKLNTAVNDVYHIIISLLGMVAAVALFLYMRRLALRIPERTLAQRTRIVMVCWIVLVVLVTAVRVCDFLAYSAGSGFAIFDPLRAAIRSQSLNVMWLRQGLLVAILPLSLILGVWALVLAGVYRKRLLAIAREIDELR